MAWSLENRITEHRKLRILDGCLVHLSLQSSSSHWGTNFTWDLHQWWRGGDFLQFNFIEVKLLLLTCLFRILNRQLLFELTISTINYRLLSLGTRWLFCAFCYHFSSGFKCVSVGFNVFIGFSFLFLFFSGRIFSYLRSSKLLRDSHSSEHEIRGLKNKLCILLISRGLYLGEDWSLNLLLLFLRGLTILILSFVLFLGCF